MPSYAIVILEDSPERQAAMRNRLMDRFPQYPVFCFHEPERIIAQFQETLIQPLLISLDHDLDLIPGPDGSWHDPGTGMTVVDWLVTQPPRCPVIIHSTNLPAAKTMKRRLQHAGWDARRITPYDDLAWIDAEWFTAARQALLRAANAEASPQPVTTETSAAR